MTATKQQRGADLETTLVRLPGELLEWARAEAAARRMSMAMLIRQILEDYRDSDTEDPNDGGR